MTTEKQERYQQVLSTARQLAERDLDWVTFFREVLGIEGVVRKAFPTFDELCEFEKSDEYDAIQRILVKLREKKGTNDSDTEPTRVITVRLPKSMHEYLRTEAHDLRTSMNKLCISKLLQVVEQDMIPAEKSAPARRRATPAPQPVTQPAVSTTPPTPQPSQSTPSASNSPFTSSSNGVSPLKTNW
ncbi:hypothetical protein [Aeoliella sp.]|uniref:hypothetical protein n=1 Tax=Aeoliella sp. TaxID=2795800 RepID=UPI003CCB73FA